MLGAPNFIVQTEETSKLKKNFENKDVEKDDDRYNSKNNEVLRYIVTSLTWKF